MNMLPPRVKLRSPLGVEAMEDWRIGGSRVR